MPNCPWLFAPQHFTAPELTAQAKASPIVINVALITPFETGLELEVVVLSPKRPFVFAPAHCTAPDTMKHVEFVPAAITLTSVIPMSMGIVLETVSPEPNWPLAFAPQHCTVALSITAHAKSLPAATDDTPEVRPVTCTGNVLNVVEPFPN